MWFNIRGVESNFSLEGQGPKELDCTESTPTYPKTGHLLRHKHSLGILVHPFCVIHNYYKLFLFIVSSIRYAAARKEIFNVNSLRGKLQQIGLPSYSTLWARNIHVVRFDLGLLLQG